ncbi:sickle tail protein-like [Boleophthalmus pectinirostris]|uniref:sickle tail protein-like n=1 Tax=Boleophthalmus pectinirostris TaxID=150288 RepID=UPI00242DDCA5|nr:sickle tail protein-like [Boleophthalmus pectinirostris]
MALLKGEFPQLQSRMCSVLRLEVEVVRFLKEEPLKMDSMLSRIRNLTEELSSLHRSVSESFVQAKDEQGSPRPLPRSSFRTPQTSSDSGETQTGPASPVTRRSTTSTPQNTNTTTEETTRIPPDGSMSPDSNQTKPDQTRTNQDRPESSQSQLNQSLQDPLTSRESPTQDPETSPVGSGAEQKSTQAQDSKHKDDSGVFKRPDRPSQNKSSRAITTSPPPQRSAVGSSVTNTKSVEAKEAAGAPVEREKVQVTKPPRQPPEVKPKPPKSAAALTGNASFNHCPKTTATTTTTNTATSTSNTATSTSNTPTATPDSSKEENNNTAEVKVHASLRASPLERSCVTYSENHHDQQKQPPTQNTTVLKPPSNLQTHVKHVSTDQTQQNGRSAASSDQNIMENSVVTQTDSASLPVLQRYAANIVSLEQISEKFNPRDNSTTSDTSSLHENGSGSPTKTPEHENGNSSGSNPAFDSQGFDDFCTDFSREPFIVVWNEAIDIEAAFNRLSTIFECEEELAKSRESVLNEDEGDAKISAPVQFTFHGDSKEDAQVKKSDGKKKFKLKFPKNKLAQISRAIRTGSGKKAKKHDETDGNRQENKKMQISSPRPKKQAKELCKNTLESIDSLEASIKQLEISVDSFGVASSPPDPGLLEGSERSKRPAPLIQKDSQPPQRKRPKQGRGEQTLLSRPPPPPRPSSDPQVSPPDLTLSPQISHRKRPGSGSGPAPGSGSRSDQVSPVSP